MKGWAKSDMEKAKRGGACVSVTFWGCCLCVGVCLGVLADKNPWRTHYLESDRDRRASPARQGLQQLLQLPHIHRQTECLCVSLIE